MRIETLLNPNLADPNLGTFIVNYKAAIEILKKNVTENDTDLQSLSLLIDCYYHMFTCYKEMGNLTEITQSIFKEAIQYCSKLLKKSPSDENHQKALLFFPIQDAISEELKLIKRKKTRTKRKDNKKQRKEMNDFMVSELSLNEEIINKIVTNIDTMLKNFKSKHSMNNIRNLEHGKIAINAYENTQQALAKTLRYIQLKYFVHGYLSNNIVVNETEFSIEIKDATLKTFDKNFYAIHPELDSVISSHTLILSTLQKHDNSPTASEIDHPTQLTVLSPENIAVQGLEMLRDIETTAFSTSINPRNP